MQDSLDTIDFGPAVHLVPGAPGGSGAEVLVVCEHASNRVPSALRGLGLSDDLLHSHIAWDPGALDLARMMAAQTGATLVHGGISRLVYDCNRPPESPGAMPERSEHHDIPGNRDLSDADRAMRVAAVYRPFHDKVSDRIRVLRPVLTLMVTVHSFTPVFQGVRRAVEIGILHGRDPGFARAMMATAPKGYDVRLNEPYSAADGVAHTLDLHGAVNGLPNVMLEVRNDLLETEQQQEEMAKLFVQWICRTRALTERGARA
ncbi:N-formylglutamate amidohydrolase [Antarctobacter jejuensis]|uniref:N-formylglutamate amidohydrolase n=1 Tax=Antarctobacter jejuensis TaxID=1439938 RepID=UPI003FD4D2D4